VYLLIPQVRRRPEPDLVLLERFPHQRGYQVPAVFGLRRPARRSAQVRRILHLSACEPARECRFSHRWSLGFQGIQVTRSSDAASDSMT
jgi:hypothetical protein